MIWVLAGVAAISAASFVYTWYMTNHLSTQDQQIKEVTGPTASEGIAIPVLFGTRTLVSPNTCWYGGQQSTKNGDGSVDYKLGLQLALCHGRLDKILAVYLSESDSNYLGTTVSVDQWVAYVWNELLDNNKDGTHGPFSGNFVFRLGGVNLTNSVDAGDLIPGKSYANTSMGYARGPKYYGVAMLESTEPIYLGTSPQLGGVAVMAQRIHTRKGGAETQWYDAKAEIALGRGREDSWKYKLVGPTDDTDYSGASYDDSSWNSGRGGFGNATQNTLIWSWVADASTKYPIPVVKTQLWPEDWPGLVFRVNSISNVKAGVKLWVRGDLGPMPKQDLGVQCWHDDAGFLWFNGTAISLVPTTDKENKELAHFTSTATIPAALVNTTGSNVVAYCVRDSYNSLTGTSNRIGANQFIYAGIQVGLDLANPRSTVDMNPIHIIREVLTDDIWGAGYSDDVIGDSFTAAADTCYAENFGLSIVWDEVKSHMDFIADILRYISGVLYIDHRTGKFEIKLIREDYAIEDLLTLDGTNTSTIQDIERQAIGQLINQVSATYSTTPRGKTGSVTVYEQNLITEQGGTVADKVDYPAVSTSFIAGRLAMRDLRTLSSPLLSCSVGANRDALDLRPGFPFILHRPDLGIDSTIMRVTEIDFGDGIKNEITIKCLEDVFYFPAEPAVACNPPISQPPVTIKVATETDDYQTALVVDSRDKGWVEAVYKSSYFQASGWVETSPGVLEWDLSSSMPVWSLGFDGVEPDVYAEGGSWLIGRRILLPAEGSPSSATRALAGPWIVGNLGGHWENFGTIDQVWVWENARLYRDPSFNQSSNFVKDMIFTVRAGTVYGGHFEQLATDNVVLGTTEQAWTDLTSVTWANTYEFLKPLQLATQNTDPNSYLLISATTSGSPGVSDFSVSFETLVGTPGARSIPAGPWRFSPSLAGVSGESVGSETLLGFKVFVDGTTPRTLFEVLSEPITSNTGGPVPPIVYVAPEFTLEEADRLVLIPTIHTTSTDPATLTIGFNAANAVRVSMPRPTINGTVTVVKPDEAWFDVTVVDGVISGFGDHRKLRVSGTGPLVGISTSGLANGVELIMSFLDPMSLTVGGTPSSGAPLANAESMPVGADSFSIVRAFLYTDSGPSAVWRLS